MSCGDVDALSLPKISRKRLLWADSIPEAVPCVKYFFSPLCLKLRIMMHSVTRTVTGYKSECRLTLGSVRLHALVVRRH